MVGMHAALLAWPFGGITREFRRKILSKTKCCIYRYQSVCTYHGDSGHTENPRHGKIFYPFISPPPFPLHIKTNNLATGLSKESRSTITGTKRIPKEEKKEEEEQEEERRKKRGGRERRVEEKREKGEEEEKG